MRVLKKRFVYITLGLCATAVLLSATFFAGAAWAADSRLDLAVDSIVKAKALLNASENPGFDPPFNYHRWNAVYALNVALREIQAAKDYADSVNPPAK